MCACVTHEKSRLLTTAMFTLSRTQIFCSSPVQLESNNLFVFLYRAYHVVWERLKQKHGLGRSTPQIQRWVRTTVGVSVRRGGPPLGQGLKPLVRCNRSRQWKDLGERDRCRDLLSSMKRWTILTPRSSGQ